MPPTSTFSYHGRTISLSGAADDDMIYREIVRKGTFYEVSLLEYAASLISGRDGLVLDVGANIGNHSVYLGTFATDHLISVEPNPVVLPALRANLAANGVDATLVEKGLGAEAGRASVVENAQYPDNYGMAELATGSGTIEIVTLDSVVADWREANTDVPATLIKIDVEGMEMEVLRGATETLARDRPDLLIEAATHTHVDALTAHLAPLGYASVGHFAATPVHHFSPSPSRAAAARARWFKIKGDTKRKLRSLRRLAS